jgi:hypothetical protein
LEMVKGKKLCSLMNIEKKSEDNSEIKTRL